MNVRVEGRLALVVAMALALRPVFADGPVILAPGARPELLQDRGAGEGPAWHSTSRRCS
jgi:hypothetical protein